MPGDLDPPCRPFFSMKFSTSDTRICTKGDFVRLLRRRMKDISANRDMPTTTIMRTNRPPRATGDLIAPICKPPLFAFKSFCERPAVGDGLLVDEEVVEVVEVD